MFGKVNAVLDLSLLMLAIRIIASWMENTTLALRSPLKYKRDMVALVFLELYRAPFATGSNRDKATPRLILALVDGHAMNDDILILRSIETNQLLDTLGQRILKQIFNRLGDGIFVGHLILHESFTDFWC